MGFRRTSIQDGLTGREEIELISSLLLKGLFFEMLNVFGVQLLNGASLSSSLTLCLSDG